MKKIVKKFEKTIILFLKICLFSSLTFIFFMGYGVHVPSLLKLSRTSGIILSTFVILGLAMMSIYGGYAIGKQKSKPIIYSLAIATVITDVITYLQLCVMRTTGGGISSFRLVQPWMLVVIIILQIFSIMCFVYLGNYIFFRINDAEKCCVITQSEFNVNKVLQKIGRFKRQYNVCDVVDYSAKDLFEIIDKNETIFIYNVPIGQRTAIIEYCYENGKNFYFNPEITDVVSSNAKHVVLDDMSFFASFQQNMSFEQQIIKRFMDILISLFAIVITSPIMIISAIIIKLYDRGPVFFRQKRATKNGKIFKVYKFRTMKQNVENYSANAEDDRITPIGKVLRKLRLDELPQFINILKGEMSIVGPRPEMLENIFKYTNELPEFEHRLKVKAGLTGFAQIAGKYNTSPKDKLILDLMYIEKFSIFNDFKLIFQTLIIFFKSDSTEGFISDADIKLKVNKHIKTN